MSGSLWSSNCTVPTVLKGTGGRKKKGRKKGREIRKKGIKKIEKKGRQKTRTKLKSTWQGQFPENLWV